MTTLESLTPFAQAFANQGAKNTIANASGDVNIAQGFSAIFSKPIQQGGKYVQRKDMNGILYLITKFLTYLQNGGVMTFDASVSNLIGGYPTDAVLNVRDASGVYVRVKSMIPNNTWNPDATSGNANFRDHKTLENGTIDDVNGVLRWKTVEYDVSYLYGKKQPTLTYLAGSASNTKSLGLTVNLNDNWRNYDRIAMILRCGTSGSVNVVGHIDVHEIFDVWWLSHLLALPSATDIWLASGERTGIALKVSGTTNTVMKFAGGAPTAIIGIRYGV